MCAPNLSSCDAAVDVARREAIHAIERELELLNKLRRPTSHDLDPDHRPDTYSATAAGGVSGPRDGALRSTITRNGSGEQPDPRPVSDPAVSDPAVSDPAVSDAPHAGYMCPADDLEPDHRPAPKRWTPHVEVPLALVAEVERTCPSASDRRLRDRLLYLLSLTCDPATAHDEHDYWVRLYSRHLADACGEAKGKACYRDLGRELEAAGLLEVSDSYSASKTRSRAGCRGRSPYSTRRDSAAPGLSPRGQRRRRLGGT
jgi:hypothetical protein